MNAGKPVTCFIASIVVGISLSLGHTDASAQPDAGSCDAKTRVVFVNGVMNFRTDARRSLDALWELYKSVVLPLPPTAEVAAPELAYNQTLLPLDFIEVLQQIMDQYDLTLTSALDIMRGGLPNEELQQYPLDEIGAQLFARLNAFTAFDLAQHMDMYDSAIDDGERLIVVAHSQGNLFANAAFAAMSADKRRYMGLVGVGTPANNVGGDYNHVTAPYVTAYEDLVISFVPTALPWNERQRDYEGDWWGHAFAEFYLRPWSVTRARIGSLLAIQAQITPFPAETCAIIEATIPENVRPAVGEVLDVSVAVTRNTELEGPNPTGHIIITLDGSGCSAALGPDGIGTCAVEPSMEGVRTLVAEYSGDSHFSQARAEFELSVSAECTSATAPACFRLYQPLLAIARGDGNDDLQSPIEHGPFVGEVNASRAHGAGAIAFNFNGAPRRLALALNGYASSDDPNFDPEKPTASQGIQVGFLAFYYLDVVVEPVRLRVTSIGHARSHLSSGITNSCQGLYFGHGPTPGPPQVTLPLGDSVTEYPLSAGRHWIHFGVAGNFVAIPPACSFSGSILVEIVR